MRHTYNSMESAAGPYGKGWDIGPNIRLEISDDSVIQRFGDGVRRFYSKNSDGNSTTYTWVDGRLTSITEPASRQVTLAYNNGYLSSISDWTTPTARMAELTIDAKGYLTSTISPDGATESGLDPI